MNTNVSFLIEKAIASEKVSKESFNKIIGESGDISIGTDTEFLWFYLNNENRLRFFEANRIFHKQGIYGTDGRSILSEFRVTPAEDVRSFLELIKYAFTLSKLYSENCKCGNPQPYGMAFYENIYSGLNIPLNESIGVHIHFGGPCYNKSLISRTVSALDVFLLPICKLFEPEIGHYIRSGIGYYGDVSDFRTKPYGMEYRSLPCFFDSEEMTFGIFAIAKAIAIECMMHGNITDDLIKSNKIYRWRLHDKKYLKLLAYRAELIIKKVCCVYPMYKKEIDFVFHMMRSGKNYAKTFSKGIFTEWGIDTSSLSHLEQETAKSPRLCESHVPFEGYNKSIDKTRMIRLS